jgi:holo-[acyl-carrier protein] synthase
MIIGIGIDLIEVGKISASLNSETYLGKVFTRAEIDECRSKANSAEWFVGKFAVKEAFMKAAGRGIRQGAWFTQIEVLNEESGLPIIQVSGKMESAIQAMGAMKVHVSVTYSNISAAAVVILEKTDDSW